MARFTDKVKKEFRDGMEEILESCDSVILLGLREKKDEVEQDIHGVLDSEDHAKVAILSLLGMVISCSKEGRFHEEMKRLQDGLQEIWDIEKGNVFHEELKKCTSKMN